MKEILLDGILNKLSSWEQGWVYSVRPESCCTFSLLVRDAQVIVCLGNTVELICRHMKQEFLINFTV